jgi:hypothetical protein
MSPSLPLRDIQLPAEPGWWPPAPGWWVVAAVVLIAVAYTAVRMQRRWVLHRRRQQRLRQWEDWLRVAGDHGPARIAAASEYLRRLARRDAPHALTLQDEAWLAYLDRDLPDAPFSSGPGRLLLDGGYRPALDPDAVDHALQAVRRRIELGLA